MGGTLTAAHAACSPATLRCRRRLLHALLSPAPPARSAAGTAWQEAHLAVLQALLDARDECVAGALAPLVAALAAAAGGPLGRSAKLAQAMMALAAGYGGALVDAGGGGGGGDASGGGAGGGGGLVSHLARAAASTQTFLTKGLLAKLKQLGGLF